MLESVGYEYELRYFANLLVLTKLDHFMCECVLFQNKSLTPTNMIKPLRRQAFSNLSAIISSVLIRRISR